MTKKKNNSSSQIEARALKISMCSHFVMFCVGITFAILAHSQAILIDGIYFLVSFIMVLISKKVAEIVLQPSSKTFHFGYANFEPLINATRSLLILMILIYAFFSAVTAIFSGGREIESGVAFFYSIIIAVVCVLLNIMQNYYAKKTNSPFLKTDAETWFIDTFISLGIAVAFGFAWILNTTSYAYFLYYVDPLIVIFICVLMIKKPIQGIRGNIQQMLYAAPNDEKQRKIGERINSVLKSYAIQQQSIRMVQIGRIFYIMIVIVIDKDFSHDSIKDQDKIRNSIAKILKTTHPIVQLDVLFTTDPRWLTGII